MEKKDLNKCPEGNPRPSYLSTCKCMTLAAILILLIIGAAVGFMTGELNIYLFLQSFVQRIKIL